MCVSLGYVLKLRSLYQYNWHKYNISCFVGFLYFYYNNALKKNV